MKPLCPRLSKPLAPLVPAAIAVCLPAIMPLAGAPLTYEPVTAFEGGAWGPKACLIAGSDGMLYGTTSSGGAEGKGTVFRTNASGTVLETILHFHGGNGSGPVASLVEWTSPGLTRYYYGTALEGGTHGFGTIFRVSSDGLAETLVEFTGTGGTHPGSYPEGALILASDGNFYGTTVSGGANDVGTVFRISPSGNHEVLFEFDSGSMDFNGATPRSALLETPAAGVFLGTTAGGGDNGDGTVFKITDTGTVTAMIHFSAYDSTRPGAGPTAPLIRGSDGNYYGTTRFGAYYDAFYKDQGTVFKMTPEGEHTVLAAFVYPIPGEHRGMWPASALVEGQDGYLYGNTIRGGNSDRGVVFRVAKTGGMTTLVDFAFDSAPKGSGANGALLQVAANEFIGTTVAGGDRNLGTVFRISNPQNSSADFATLINFTGQAPGFTTGPKEPEGGLLKASDGFFYGTTLKGGALDKGTVFRCDSEGNTTVLVEFTGNGMENKGGFPASELIEGGDGNFYGTTQYGGANDLGTVFRMTPGGVLTTLLEFSGTAGSHPGSWPRCGLTDGGNGYYYGTTYLGGTHEKGTVFRVSYAGTGETLVHFSGDETVAKGIYPLGTLLLASDGNLYGTTEVGGDSSNGTAFRMSPSGLIATIHEFGLFSAYPQGLIEGDDGNFYGVCRGNGYLLPFIGVTYFNNGNVFRLTPEGDYLDLGNFYGDEDNGTKGSHPEGRLHEGPDGFLYGTTSEGGSHDRGTLFRCATYSGYLSTLIEFTGSRGASPGASPGGRLIPGEDGALYGVTSLGGVTAEGDPAGCGQVFRLLNWSYVEPRLTVREGSRTLANGRVWNFGRVAVKKKGRPKTLLLGNEGSEDLALTSVSITGKNRRDYKASAPSSRIIPPGSTVNLRLRLRPLAKGTRKASLQIRNTSVIDPRFVVNLTGRGI